MRNRHLPEGSRCQAVYRQRESPMTGPIVRRILADGEDRRRLPLIAQRSGMPGRSRRAPCVFSTSRDPAWQQTKISARPVSCSWMNGMVIRCVSCANTTHAKTSEGSAYGCDASAAHYMRPAHIFASAYRFGSARRCRSTSPPRRSCCGQRRFAYGQRVAIMPILEEGKDPWREQIIST